MSFALNEVEAMAKRATRGAGYPWGLAEEASKATRWLCAQGLDGCAVLAGVLTRDEATRGCSLTEGATLSDQASLLAGGAKTMTNLAYPAMILPFARLAARQIGKTVTVSDGQAVAVTDGEDISLDGEFQDSAAALTVEVGGQLGQGRAKVTRATPDADAWRELTRLAHLTYAPATEESRRLGAGTGLSDND